MVVYTAIFGDYNELIKQPKYDGVDYVCFTDRPLKENGWNVVVVKPPQRTDHTRNNRYFKIMPHLFFLEYKYSLYIDGNFILKKNPLEMVKSYLIGLPMACFDHNQTVRDARNCIYKEYDAIVDLSKKTGQLKDDLKVMKRQIESFRTEGFPEDYGLISGGVLLRAHHDKKLISVMEDWWKIVKEQSKRDQLSFNYLAWKHHFKYQIIPGDIRRKNRFVYYLGKHKSNAKTDVIKYKIKKFLRLN